MARWAGELDTHPGHGGLWGTSRDNQRDRQLHLVDWQVEHVSPVDMLDIDGLLDELAALYLARVARIARRAA